MKLLQGHYIEDMTILAEGLLMRIQHVMMTTCQSGQIPQSSTKMSFRSPESRLQDFAMSLDACSIL